jgi:cell division protein FtsB
MGAPTGIDVEALRQECEQLKAENVQLEEIIRDLNEK